MRGFRIELGEIQAALMAQPGVAGAEVQVQQARDRAPQNAGPLNPQRLVLETLARMGELSPHYLRRFLTHTETLLWLEQAHGVLRQPAAGKAVKARRQKM